MVSNNTATHLDW